LLPREECRVSGRGRKSTDRHCGQAIEAQADHRSDQPIRGRVEREPVTDYEETWQRSGLMGRSDYGGARKDVPLRINGGKSRAATAGPDVASRRADGRLRVTEKGMWPYVVSSSRPRTWRDRDREWSQLKVTAGHRWSQAPAGRCCGRTATHAERCESHELRRLSHVASVRRSGIGRRTSSISRVSCATRRSSRVAFASASSARLRSAAFCVASCRS